MFAAEAALVALSVAAPARSVGARSFDVPAPGEAVALIRAGCAGCAWGEEGREAAAVTISLDGAYSQHLLLVRGSSPAEYRVSIGAVAAGTHRLTIDRDA